VKILLTFLGYVISMVLICTVCMVLGLALLPLLGMSNNEGAQIGMILGICICLCLLWEEKRELANRQPGTDCD
jgi:hypothetical protein